MISPWARGLTDYLSSASNPFLSSPFRKQIPRGWYWFSVIDFLTYSWGGLMKNQFKNFPDAKVNDEQVLKFYGHDDYVSQGAYTGYLSIFFFVFAFLAYLALAFKKMDNR